MIKQTLFFSTPVSLSLKNYQMVISWKDRADKVTRPIEDMGCVVLENQQISVTLPLLNELVKNNVAVVLCDNKQMPTAMLQCLDGNTTQAESLKYQLAVGEATKKQAWKQIIEAKIKNQAVVLRHYGKRSELLTPYYKNVKSGDTDNRGLAAKQYWTELFGGCFKRDREGGSPNDLLNYGYAILRAATTRALIGSGLLPNLGIFHKKQIQRLSIGRRRDGTLSSLCGRNCLFALRRWSVRAQQRVQIRHTPLVDVRRGHGKSHASPTNCLDFHHCFFGQTVCWRNQKTNSSYHDMTEYRLNAYHIMYLLGFFIDYYTNLNPLFFIFN